MVRHGGGAFSGKDPTKVDRSGAYFCRWVARQVVEQGIARRAEVQVSYASGQAKPMRLGLDRPIYRQTTNYGHFGRPGLPWEMEG